MKRIRYLLIAAAALMCTAATAQKTINERQYWIDGNITDAQTLAESPTSIGIGDLKPGLHSLTVRVKDSEGLWSSQVAKYFIKPFAENGVADNGIQQHQYWIDGDLQAAVTSPTQPSAIVIGELKPGLHSLTVRVQDKAGMWSSQVAKYFIVPFVSNDVTGKTIKEHQYWIDGKIEARVTQEQQPSTIDIETLKPGLHSFTVRVKDNTGMWSSQVAKYFIVPTAETSVGDKSIVLHQYWIDGKLDAIVSSETQPSQIPISTLKPGLHSLTVRVKDNTGLWSSQVAKYFIVKDDDVMEETTITRYMYWFDEETADFKTGPLTSASGTMDIDISDVEAGIHTLWWRCGDSKGAWSEARSVTFESKSLYNYTVPNSGIGTFSADVNLTLPDGLKAHFCTYLKEVDEGLAIKILNIDGKVINQNTGVLLSGTPGETYQLRYTSEAGSATDGNKLVPVVESTHVEPVVGDYTNYIMQGGQFIKIKQEEAGNEDIKMPAHRAYLPLLTTDVSPTSGGAKSVVLLLWDDDVVTGIESTEKVDYEPARDGHVYSISGQRLSAPRKGINIINGRKVIVK
jgi:hypothetical protein